MDMDVPVLEQAVVYAVVGSMRLDVLQGQHGRLLHHIAKVASQCEFALFAFAQACFDEEYLAAHAGPCQTGHHAGILVALVFVAVELRWSEVGLDVGGIDRGNGGCGSVFLLLERYSAQYFVDFLVEFANARLASVVLYHSLYGVFTEFHLPFVHAHVLQFLGDEVSFGDFYLFLSEVAADLNQFHSVEEWSGDGADVVGRCDEHHLREVVVEVNVVVVEGIVLFRVEHLEQG